MSAIQGSVLEGIHCTLLIIVGLHSWIDRCQNIISATSGLELPRSVVERLAVLWVAGVGISHPVYANPRAWSCT